MYNERGLSNTLGFVLLFGVVFISITAVSVFGVGALEESRDATIEQNAALSMESVSDAIGDLRDENVTTRLSVLRGGGGTIGGAEQTTITVSVDGSQEYQRDFQPIVYRFEQTNLVYEAGAVMRTQGDSGVLLDAPDFEVTSDVAILPIIATTPATSGATSGNTMTLYLERMNSSLVTDSLPSGVVEIEIDTTDSRVGVWNRVLENRYGMSCSITGGTISCHNRPAGSSTIIVRDIQVSYDVDT